MTDKLLDNLSALADRLETFSTLLETAHREIQAERKKTDDLLHQIKREQEARGYGVYVR